MSTPPTRSSVLVRETFRAKLHSFDNSGPERAGIAFRTGNQFRRSVMTEVSDCKDIAASLKLAMRFTPSPVAIVTTADESLLHKAGMVVSAFVPVSMEPPSMQICINRSAGAYDLLMRHGTFCVNVLGMNQAEELAIFADPSRREERFANARWRGRHGTMFLEGALSSIFCRTKMTQDVGTHSIMIGEVVEAIVADLSMPAVWHAGRMLAVNAG